MSFDSPDIGPQVGSEVQQLLSQYKGVYEQSKARVDQMDDPTQVRTQLEDFLKANDFQLPKEKKEIMENEQLMRGILTIALADQQLKPIRDQILQKIDRDMAAAPVAERYSVLRRHFDSIASESPADMFLFSDLMARMIGAEATELGLEYNKAGKRPLVDSGRNWILNGGEKPSEFSVQQVPQLVIFNSFRLNVLFQEEFKDLKSQLGREVNSIDEFVEKTFSAYLKFIEKNKVNRDLFCPNIDFYKKLCTASGITTEMLAGIDTSNLATANTATEFDASQQRNEAFFKQRQEHHEREQERLNSQVTQLKAESTRLRAAGDTLRANEIDLQVLTLEGQAKNHETKAKEFEGLIDASEEVTDLRARELAGSEAARALIPNADYMENLPGVRGYIGTAFAATSRGMDWIGRQIPDTGDPMSWSAGGMAVGAVKVGLAAGGIINLIKGLAPTYMGLHKMGGIALNPWNYVNPKKWGELLSSPTHLLKGMWASTKEVGSFAAAAGTFAAVKYGTLENADRGLEWIMNAGGTAARRVANNELVPEVGHALRDLGIAIREHGPAGLKKYLIELPIDLVKKVWGWGGQFWDIVKDIAGDLDVEIDEYESFYQDMEASESHFKQQMSASPTLQRLGMTVDISSVSQGTFGRMCQSYSNRNRNHDQSQGVLSLSLEEVADGGFLYLGGSNVTKEQLRNNDNYKSIPDAEKVITVSPELSGKLIKQADFWYRNYPDDSRRREEITPTA
jgi:hypothetical protein